MAKYYYHLDFYIKTELTQQFEYYFAKMIKARAESMNDIKDKIKFYRTFAGGNDIITVTIEMDSIDEIDLWGHTPVAVMQYYGNEKGLSILDLYCKSMIRWKSRITRPFFPFEMK